MQRKENFGRKLLNEVKSLPNKETPNYKNAAAATVFLAFTTLASSMNCGSFSFYLNALGTVLAASVTTNQYLEGAPLNTIKSTYAGFFGSSAKPQPTAAAEATEDAEAAPASPGLQK